AIWKWSVNSARISASTPLMRAAPALPTNEAPQPLSYWSRLIVVCRSVQSTRNTVTLAVTRPPANALLIPASTFLIWSDLHSAAEAGSVRPNFARAAAQPGVVRLPIGLWPPMRNPLEYAAYRLISSVAAKVTVARGVVLLSATGSWIVVLPVGGALAKTLLKSVRLASTLCDEWRAPTETATLGVMCNVASTKNALLV